LALQPDPTGKAPMTTAPSYTTARDTIYRVPAETPVLARQIGGLTIRCAFTRP
jgi:hypothetical protein